MKIVFKKSFIKQYSKLDIRRQNSVDTSLRLFESNPQDPTLKNHALNGKLRGKRAIAAGFDLRIVFKMEGDYVMIEMLGVGNHTILFSSGFEKRYPIHTRSRRE